MYEKIEQFPFKAFYILQILKNNSKCSWIHPVEAQYM